MWCDSYTCFAKNVSFIFNSFSPSSLRSFHILYYFTTVEQAFAAPTCDPGWNAISIHNFTAHWTNLFCSVYVYTEVVVHYIVH